MSRVLVSGQFLARAWLGEVFVVAVESPHMPYGEQLVILVMRHMLQYCCSPASLMVLARLSRLPVMHRPQSSGMDPEHVFLVTVPRWSTSISHVLGAVHDRRQCRLVFVSPMRCACVLGVSLRSVESSFVAAVPCVGLVRPVFQAAC